MGINLDFLILKNLSNNHPKNLSHEKNKFTVWLAARPA
jgi:hypothetical protein